MANTFIVSDETRNTYGFIVLTDGIGINPFLKNPVMFYMHDREKGVVGRWENIRKEDKKLLADAVFDDSTELGTRVKKQVEGGFLRCASIGIEIISSEIQNGIETVTKCLLTEISIVDIPANENAVKLHKRVKKGGRTYLKLSTRRDGLRDALISVLKLDEDATDEEIINEVFRITQAIGGAGTLTEEALRAGLISNDNRNEFYTMERVSPELCKTFIEREKNKALAVVQTVFDNAVKERRVFGGNRELYISIGMQIGPENFAKLLTSIPPTPKLSDYIGPTETLDNYRRNHPEELRRNPKLYQRLIEQEESEPTVKDFDYYRKYDPEYFRDNPEKYKEMIEKEQAKQ